MIINNLSHLEHLYDFRIDGGTGNPEIGARNSVTKCVHLEVVMLLHHLTAADFCLYRNRVSGY